MEAKLYPQTTPSTQERSSTGDQGLELLTSLLRQWRVFVAFAVFTPGFTLVLSFLMPLAYRASTSFVPQSRAAGRLQSSLAGLSSQLGLSLGPDANQSPRFYATVVTSREVLEQALVARFAAPGTASDSAQLLDIFRVSGRSARDRIEKGVRKLRRKVSVDVDNQTGVVTLSVEAPDPALAAAVANRFIEFLNEFNVKTRNTSAREQRQFTAERVAEEGKAMQAAEEGLAHFYERNRQWQQSPQLVVEEARLRRQIELRQQLYIALKREFDTARIEELNNTPVIAVIDTAVPPQRPAKPRRVILVVLGLLFGTVVGAVAALWSEHVYQIRRGHSAAYQQFEEALHRASSELAGLVKPRRHP